MSIRYEKYRYKCTNNDWHETDYITNPPVSCPNSFELNYDSLICVDSVMTKTIIYSETKMIKSAQKKK